MTSIPVGTCKISRNKLKRQLSQKQKIFSGLFIAFLKCALNLEHFENNDEHPGLIISKIIDSERGGNLNV